jgi:uncharacterized membrane protein YdjX (TVP38/TMEM64 family)
MTNTMGPTAADRRRATWAPILLRVGLLLAVLGPLAVGAQLLGPWSPDRLQRLLTAAGPLAPAAFVAVFVVLNSVGVPAPMLGAAGGLTLGVIPGALATLAGMTLAACVQLLLGRRLAGSAIATARLPGTRRLQKVLQGRGWLAVVALRLVPGPFPEVNMAAGLTSLRVRSMAISTPIGGAPKALGWAALGLGGTHLPAAPALMIAAVVAGLILTVVWVRRRGQPPAAAYPEPAPTQRPNPAPDPPALERAADNRSGGRSSC